MQSYQETSIPKHILAHAQGLVYTLAHLMPSPYQQETLQALLELFLEATGQSLPAHSKVKSASAISRFLNQYQWPTRQVIRAVRQAAIERLLKVRMPGRQPYLQVILDLIHCKLNTKTFICGTSCLFYLSLKEGRCDELADAICWG